MATCQKNPKIWWGQSLAALTYILQYAERQTPFNPDEMDIERKLFALAIWIWVGTPHLMQPEAPSPLKWQQQPLSLGTVR